MPGPMVPRSLLSLAALLALVGVVAASERSLLFTPCDTTNGDWARCCEGKQWTGDSNCPPASCNILSGANLDACCSYKGGPDQDPTCPAGPTYAVAACQRRGPELWWQCCADIGLDPARDSTCPPQDCTELAGDGLDACCDFYGLNCQKIKDQIKARERAAARERANIVSAATVELAAPAIVAAVADALAPPCSSNGTANWWACCVAKAPGTDFSCPPPKCSDLSVGYDECCNYKGNYQDPSCYIKLCYNFNQLSLQVDAIVDSAVEALTLATDNVTEMYDLAQSTFKELFHVLTGTSENYTSTII